MGRNRVVEQRVSPPPLQCLTREMGTGPIGTRMLLLAGLLKAALLLLLLKALLLLLKALGQCCQTGIVALWTSVQRVMDVGAGQR